MLYSVFRLSCNPHWSPLSTRRLRNIKSPSQYSRTGNWGFKRWKDSPRILNLGWGKGRIWTLVFQISPLCRSSSPSWWASLYFGPLSCTTLSLLDLQGSVTLLHHEPIRFFSLQWHNVSILFFYLFNFFNQKGGEKKDVESTDLSGGFLWERIVRSLSHNNIHFSFKFQKSCHPHGISSVRCPCKC